MSDTEYQDIFLKEKEKNCVRFDIINVNEMLLEIVGVFDYWSYEYKDPPAPLVKGQKVHLISGKFPLHDYKDCSGYGNHLYTFKKEDGSIFTGILCGFTYDCTYACEQDLGITSIDVIITKV